MIKTLLIILSIAFSSFAVFAQQFTFFDAGLVNASRSSVAWADYDNDGDLDVLITGDKGSGPYIASIYKNNSGVFSNINAGLTGIYNSAVAWGDYDGDGDMDILATGRNASNSKTFIYQNNNGLFTQKEMGLPNIGSDGAVAWGDYDNDSDLDILISGNYTCKVFNNNAGVFTSINANLPYISNCWVDWGDFDNDGLLDIFVMGDLGGILAARIYRNTQGTFIEAPDTGIIPLIGGSASWADFDNDNDLDLLQNGFDEFLEPKTTIYSNIGNMQFLDISPGITNSALGTVAWADYDNDGDADVLLTGQNLACGSMSSKVYRNDDDVLFADLNENLEGAERGSSNWVDFDNDGDLDILISGTNSYGSASTRMYRNNFGTNVFSSNQAPSIPENLTSSIDDHKVTLSWSASTDNISPSSSLTYNIRIGTEPGTQNIVSSMSNLTSGQRLLPKEGNAFNNTSWYLNLPDGTYYWSVQAVDQSFAASAFAPEQSFTILNVGLNESYSSQIILYPNPVTNILYLQSNEDFSYTIYTLDGKPISESRCSAGNALIHTSNWLPGIYMIRMQTTFGTQKKMIIKK